MKEIVLEEGQGFTVEITSEGKVLIRIGEDRTSLKNLNTNLTHNTEDKSTIELRNKYRRNEECEGDYKGEQLKKVKMVKSELDSLESSLGISCLKYWIISLNSFADNEPNKFGKYKCHRACIQNWHRMRLEKGMVFSHIHPSGHGYYWRREIESLKPEQLKLK